MTADIADVVDRFNRAWNDHEIDAALAVTTQDIVFDSTRPAPDGERYVGQDAVRTSKGDRR